MRDGTRCSMGPPSAALGRKEDVGEHYPLSVCGIGAGSPDEKSQNASRVGTRACICIPGSMGILGCDSQTWLAFIVPRSLFCKIKREIPCQYEQLYVVTGNLSLVWLPSRHPVRAWTCRLHGQLASIGWPCSTRRKDKVRHRASRQLRL